ncbi:hypothetical protein TD95_001117 [Thielaviopsis punctulata]|uniref:Uncharacterized protein n=1 Tax=Thielaviopsis punctulata TaxID=72032 RepID=A0A0F4ZB48_9PEZI|nr:hypothetical protein TD95_001117 [Thielaviopsis punctulata]
MKQVNKVSYCATSFFTTAPAEGLCRFLVDSTDGAMQRAYIVNSGSAATEAAIKLARQYFLEKSNPEPERSHYISRNQSYHGITLGALAISGHQTRRQHFEPLLNSNTSKVSPCFPYRGQKEDESDEEYLSRLLGEIDAEFQRVGSHKVAAFIMEPIVGAALGCVPAVPGYIAGVRKICDKYGALLILDEVMCGMGRSGTLHAWQHDGTAPDIQTIGKGLGGGYQPIAGVLICGKVIDALNQGTGSFVHGQTYQCHPLASAASLEVQRIIQTDNLLDNVRKMGSLLFEGLSKALLAHPNIGDVRGRGLFWGVELVQDKTTKAPFPASKQIASRLCSLAISEKYNFCIYPGSGTADGVHGDHFIVSPAYTITEDDVGFIVSTIKAVVEEFFSSEI